MGTKAQEKALTRIKSYFETWWNAGQPCHKVEVTMIDTGCMHFAIETTDCIFTLVGASGWIGRRGGITWLYNRGLTLDIATHARAVGGKVYKVTRRKH